ncbi:MAG: molybdopterin-guanine dinucleotide biosynthesis protein B [Burkholderiales bacterium]
MKAFGFAGWSGSGKTTLIEQLIPLMVARALRVSLIKHAHHDFDVDQPGKDSHRHRMAGCSEVLVSSAKRWALIHELRDAPEASLEEHLERLSACDVVLVEGFKRNESIPKLEIHRAAGGKPLLYAEDPQIVAIATDSKINTRLPLLDINKPAQIVDFILAHLGIIEPVEKRSERSS